MRPNFHNSIWPIRLALLSAALFLVIARAEAGPPTLHGEQDQFVVIEPAKAAPLSPILDGTGRRLDLTAFRGRVVLLNLWATWCGPCVREMPSLDRLQAAFGGVGLSVVALSIDRGGATTVRPFFARLGLKNLDIYLDPNAVSISLFAAPGLPASYILDRDGRLRGRLGGAAAWDSPQARALLRHYLDGE